MDELKSNELISRILKMNWLRPEGVAWDTVATILLRKHLFGHKSRMDFGSGNGYTTFLASGGKFTDSYDWYYNVNLDGFAEGADIYDHSVLKNINDFIEIEPEFKWNMAVDHKNELLKQADQLKLYENIYMVDGNQENYNIAGKYDFIFSNMLYWLKDPFSALSKLEKLLLPGGFIAIAFPNSNFYKSAESYQWKAKNSNLLRLINRGRADSIMWNMDYSDFKEGLLNKKINLEVNDFTTYLSPGLLKVWDVGLRPLSPALIGHVNRLDKVERLKFKQEWCDSILPIVREQVENEISLLNHGSNGFNFVVLKKE